jgi:hypothetical protein
VPICSSHVIDGIAVEHDAIGAVARGRPVGRDVVRHAVDVLDHDRVAAVDDADRLEAHRGDRARLDHARGDLEPLVGDALVVGLADRVELHAQVVGDHAHGRPPRRLLDARDLHDAAVLGRLAESEHLEHRERDR